MTVRTHGTVRPPLMENRMENRDENRVENRDKKIEKIGENRDRRDVFPLLEESKIASRRPKAFLGSLVACFRGRVLLNGCIC
jgi:hypothetical protein